MNKLIYILSNRVWDQDYQDSTDIHYKWLQLNSVSHWPNFTCSRVHQLDTPWPLAPSLLPMPNIVGAETNFCTVMDSIADKFCKQIQASDKIPYVRWSGGIDSTAIIVSLLRVADPETLKKIIVLCSQSSIAENPYFYNKFIANKFQIQADIELEVTTHNYDKILVVDGDCAEMIAGSTVAYKLVRSGLDEILHKPWKDVDNLPELLNPSSPKSAVFAIELIQDSIKYSTIPIVTVYDFFYWHYFNFKFNDSLMRGAEWYTKNLSPTESKSFFDQGLHRFFTYNEMQAWSMLTTDIRREFNSVDSKYFFKKYIYDFDHNDFYFYNKHKHISLSTNWVKHKLSSTLFAIDMDWNRYSYANRDHRQLIYQASGN